MKKLILAIIFTLLLGACGSTGDQVFEPEAVNEGVDRCDVCNMLVPNDHHATQIILNDGRSLKFDDIGCMVVWEEENGLDEVNVRYVRDYVTEEWVTIEDATFVYHPEFRTPMAYGMLSFLSGEDAEKYVEMSEKGTVLTYSDLEGHEWERNMEIMEEMGHDHEHDHDAEDGHGEHDEDDHDEGHNH